MSANKFAAALKSEKKQPETEPIRQTSEASPHRRPSRRAAKHIGGYFDPAVSKQLRAIALDEDSSLQALLAEAIDMLFQSRRKPTIASKNSPSQ